MKFNIPEEIKDIVEKFQKAGFQAYLVGGCVRDILMAAQESESRQGQSRKPKDWDIATNAWPEEIQKIFPDSVYENKFGTVLVKLKPQIVADRPQNSESALNVVEITTFRLEGKYTDKRHPDEIKFAKTIEDDLARRDFTINALALSLIEGTADKFIDPFGGEKDIKNRIIRTVGNPVERFNEDALRLIRAVRFATELDFKIEEKTEEAIKKEAGLLEMIAKERIRDELVKIIITERAKEGIEKLEELGLLKYIMPELREGIGVEQNKHHIYTVWEHNLRSMDYAAKKGYSLEIRLASLLHDVGKPRTKVGDGPNSTFYNHEIVGAKMTAQLLDKLHFPKSIVEKVTHLVRYHLFYYNVGEVTEAGVRRFLRRVGPENVDDLIKVREAERIGSGVPKAIPYKIRHLLFMIDKVKRDPISPKMLAINGEDVMKILKIKPGPKVGWILAILLDEIIDEPKKNTREYLKSRIQNLAKLAEKELENLAKQARERKEEFESGIEEEMKKKFYVK